MKRLVCVVLGLCIGCARVGVSDSAIELERGLQATVSLTVITDQRAAPVWAVTPLPPEAGLSAQVAGVPPNPKNIRGVVTISASLTATLGRQVITVSAPEVGSVSIEVDVKAKAPLVLERNAMPRATIASVEGQPSLIVWATVNGTVMQRKGSVTTEAPSLSNIVSVGAALLEAYALGSDGALWRWNWSTLSAPMKLRDGVAAIEVSDFARFALLTDGRVVDLVSMNELSNLQDVVAMRVSGFTQQIINGGGSYRSTTRVFLKSDGTAEQRASIEYESNQLPNTEATSVLATGVRQVTAHGFVQAGDGRILLGNATVHDLPARRIASKRTSNQSNASTFTSALSCFTLFDDGALWQTAVSRTSGENQQGAPSLSEGVTQAAVRAPADAPIVDFQLIGRGLVISLDDGKNYLLPEGGDVFTAPDFEGLLRR